MYLPFGAALAALAAGAAGIVLVYVLLSGEPGPTRTASTTTPTTVAVQPSSPVLPGGRIATPDEPGFPSPPPGALVLSREAGDHALAIALRSGLVRVSVLSPYGGGQRGMKVSLRLANGDSAGTSVCGAGCYQAKVDGVPSSPVTVLLDGTAYRFAFPKLPLADGTAIVDKAAATWNALRSLVWHERLASSPTNVIHTVYTAVAPNELAYDVEGRSAAVIIGGKRWDRPTPTAAWVSSVQDPQVRQPQPFWQLVSDARVLGTGRLDGHAVWIVSFFDPVTPAWFEAWIDRRSDRTLQLEMIAASHFMHDVYGPFDSPIELEPPSDQ